MKWNKAVPNKQALLPIIILVVLTFPLILYALGNLEKGEKIYNRYCMECHGADGKGILAPPFVESERFKSPNGVVALIDYIMPATRPDLCTGTNAEQVAAYVIEKFRFKVPQDTIDAAEISNAAEIKILFEHTCSVCHGVDGKGDLARPIIGSTLFKTKKDVVRFIDSLMPFHNPRKCKQACADHTALYILDNFKLKISDTE